MSADTTTLQDRVVLVTGGARRIGAEIARTLHAAGARVMIHYRKSAQDANGLAAELNARRARSAATVAAALTDEDAPARVMAATLEAFGQLDILVNNASSFFATPVGTITSAQWDDLLGSNLKAPLFVSQAAVPALKARQGLIINLVDIHGLKPLKAHPVYSAAKAGLIMLTRSLAKELGPEIRVNGIAPGPILWPEQGGDDSRKASIIEATLLKRIGDPTDIARTARFLAADAPFITGQIIAVDGGRSVAW